MGGLTSSVSKNCFSLILPLRYSSANRSCIQLSLQASKSGQRTENASSNGTPSHGTLTKVGDVQPTPHLLKQVFQPNQIRLDVIVKPSLRQFVTWQILERLLEVSLGFLTWDGGLKRGCRRTGGLIDCARFVWYIYWYSAFQENYCCRCADFSLGNCHRHLLSEVAFVMDPFRYGHLVRARIEIAVKETVPSIPVILVCGCVLNELECYPTGFSSVIIPVHG